MTADDVEAALDDLVAAEVALVAEPWTIAGRTYSAADVFRAVDPAGFALFRDLVRAEHAPAE